jgi:hypothetical protein
MNASASASPLDKAHQLVGAVVNILEKLHGEGFLAPGVFMNLGLSKIKVVLSQPPSQERLQELQGFVVQIDALFASRQLLHASATEKFQALFSGYLQAALQACMAATETENTRPPTR